MELLLSQFSVAAIPLLIYTLNYQRDSIHAILFEMNRAGWICWLGLAIGIYIIGNYTQIYATRLIGAANHSASNSMRLVAAVAGSALVLKEPLSGWIEILGLVLIVTAIAGYWYIRRLESNNSGTAEKEVVTDRKEKEKEKEKGNYALISPKGGADEDGGDSRESDSSDDDENFKDASGIEFTSIKKYEDLESV